VQIVQVPARGVSQLVPLYDNVRDGACEIVWIMYCNSHTHDTGLTSIIDRILTLE
jgi:hypothetical protein